MRYAFDCETTGLEPHLGSRAFLVTWCDEEGATGSCRIGIDDMMPFAAILQDPTNEIIGHNLGFDLAFFRQFGIEVAGRLHDTMIAAHLHSPLTGKRLKDLTTKHLGRDNKEEAKLEDWFKANGMEAKDKREYIKVPEEIILPYALADVEMTMDLWKFYKKLGICDLPVYDLECRLIRVCMDIVKHGMKIDETFVKAEAARTAQRTIELAVEGKMKYDIDNLDSNDQVAHRLFDLDGLTCKFYTPKGNVQLDDWALQEYDHPLVPVVREYRDVTKMNSTYLQPMLLKTDKEGVIHASLNQVGARTGRFSSSGPNLQNIPRSGGVVDIRRGFVVRSPAHSLLLVDLSQIELRLLAHYTEEPIMLDALRRRDGDLHAETAQALFNSKEERFRTIAKTMNFAIIYGAGAKKLKKTLNTAVPEMNITLEETYRFKAEYFAKFPKVREFMRLIEGLVRTRAASSEDGCGWVTGMSGRKYFCEASSAYRILNYLIQGESAMFFKKKMIDLHALLAGYPNTWQNNCIHDEFIFDLHNDDRSLIPSIVSTIEDLSTYRVPIFAKATISETNWAEKHSL